MTTPLPRPHRMLVVHNLVNSGDKVHVIERKPFRKFAFGSLLAYVDEVLKRLGGQPILLSDSLALPGDVEVYGQDQLRGSAVTEKYDSVMCHLVLDHGGVVADDFFSTLRADFLAAGGSLLNAVKSITKTDVARASQFELETDTAPCVIKKNNNYNKPETVFEIHTRAELEAWRAKTPAEEQKRYVMHKLLRYFGGEQAGMYQLERWLVLFDELTVNHRYSNEFYVKRGTSLSFYARDERRMSGDLARLAESGYVWKGRSIDCAYDHDPEAWDARYAVLENFRDAFQLDYAELDVIRTAKDEFVVIDVNNTPGPSYENYHFRELAVRLLLDGLRVRGFTEASRAPRPRTNICLCMVVENDAETLPSTLRSVKDYIDHYVIIDAGSTDGTIELIKREMSGYGIAGEVHEREWVSTGTHRQEALDLAVAAGAAGWLLFLDADEELGVNDPKFYENLEPGTSYDLEKRLGDLWHLTPRLLNVKSSRFEWQGPAHPDLVTLAGRKQRQRRTDVWIIHRPGERTSAYGLSEEQRLLRDAKLLEDALAQDPANARNQFYLAQTYRDAGQYERAYLAYKQRAQMDGWDQETFAAQLEAARAAFWLEKPDATIVREFLDAFALRPTRVEPLHDLARYFRLKEQYGKAYVFARTAVEIEPPADTFYVSQQVYDWRMLDELAVAAYWVGDYTSAKEACETLLWRVEHGVLIPNDELERIKENLAEATSKLGG